MTPFPVLPLLDGYFTLAHELSSSSNSDEGEDMRYPEHVSLPSFIDFRLGEAILL
jgi:hypothetical protein